MTFLTDVMKKGYTEEEILAVLVESEKNRKRRRMLAIAAETFDAHRLQKMRDLQKIREASNLEENEWF